MPTYQPAYRVVMAAGTGGGCSNNRIVLQVILCQSASALLITYPIFTAS